MLTDRSPGRPPRTAGCSTDEVDEVARPAAEDGCLVLGPMYRNPDVGYIYLIKDPDGNNVEFSVEQVLG